MGEGNLFLGRIGTLSAIDWNVVRLQSEQLSAIIGIRNRIDKNPNYRETRNELARETPTKVRKETKHHPASTEVASSETATYSMLQVGQRRGYQRKY